MLLTISTHQVQTCQVGSMGEISYMYALSQDGRIICYDDIS